MRIDFSGSNRCVTKDETVWFSLFFTFPIYSTHYRGFGGCRISRMNKTDLTNLMGSVLFQNSWEDPVYVSPLLSSV